ncbi:MAG: hypothetical protein U5N86_07345 [Planctomycetota bacterium]|nr:hypothetical protein [Planctomycetota bacterium]
MTETFVALKLLIDNWRWAGVPFYLRTGKRLPKKVSEVSVHFRKVPHMLFSGVSDRIHRNFIAIRIQPEEGISLRFGSKVPGMKIRVQPVKMNFEYGGSFASSSPDAYERLLLDCITGDMTLFTHEQEAFHSWQLIDGIRDSWVSGPTPEFPNYSPGTWGPDEADQLLLRDNRKWRRL